MDSKELGLGIIAIGLIILGISLIASIIQSNEKDVTIQTLKDSIYTLNHPVPVTPDSVVHIHYEIVIDTTNFKRIIEERKVQERFLDSTLKDIQKQEKKKTKTL